jgi:hypothetical protein
MQSLWKDHLITKDFFGHMIQGEWVADDGTTYQPVSVFIGLLRTWDSRSVWKFMVRPDGSIDWSGLEANIAFAERVGAEVMFVFGAPPASSCVPGSDCVPTLDAWKEFVTQVVTKARGRIKYYELWNEPEIAMYWNHTAAELVDYARVAYQIIKAMQPDAIVLSPSMTELNQPWGAGFASGYFGSGGGEWCDGAVFHHYQDKPEKLLADWKVFSGILNSYKLSNLPVYNTEFNYVNKDVNLRNAYIAQFMLIAASLGIKGVVYDPETEEAANDYTDATAQKVADMILGSSVGAIEFFGDTRRVVVAKTDQALQEVIWTEDQFPQIGPYTLRKSLKRGCSSWFNFLRKRS